MKKNFLRPVLAGLFAISIGTVGVAFAQVASAGPGPLWSCPATCVFSNGCPGVPCTCTLDQGNNSYYCKLNTK